MEILVPDRMGWLWLIPSWVDVTASVKGTKCLSCGEQSSVFIVNKFSLAYRNDRFGILVSNPMIDLIL